MKDKKETKDIKKMDAYQPEYYALTPSAGVKFLRVFCPWQIIRFFAINLKMVQMISKSHGDKEKPD